MALNWQKDLRVTVSVGQAVDEGCGQVVTAKGLES